MMQGVKPNLNRRLALAAAALFVAVTVVAAVQARWASARAEGVETGTTSRDQAARNVAFAWAAVGAAVVAAGLSAAAGMGVPHGRMVACAATVPAALVFIGSAPPLAPHLQGVLSGSAIVNIAGFVGAGAAATLLILLVRRFDPMKHYGMAVGVLAVASVFFTLWEPPPPKPLDPQQPLDALIDRLVPEGWRARPVPMQPGVEEALGADEYLSIELESVGGKRRAMIFIPYNADAMSNIPHVPWVCMTQAGYALVNMREDALPMLDETGREMPVNVILFEPGLELAGRPGALMFHTFNVGWQFTADRQMARWLATTGALGETGSYLTQIQVVIYLTPDDREAPLDEKGEAYRLGASLVQHMVPILEKAYYPRPQGAEGG